MLRNLVISLFLTEPDEGEGLGRVVTTREKAKEARRLAEKVITLGKDSTLASRRRALQVLGGNKKAVRKVFERIAPRYATRPGGYTRILGFPRHRLGDNATQVIFELVGPMESAAAAPEVVKETPAAAPTPAPEGAKETPAPAPETPPAQPQGNAS